jgi:hypothetical protein
VKSPVDLGKWRCKTGVIRKEKKKKNQPAIILRRRIFTQINYEKGELHPV